MRHGTTTASLLAANPGGHIEQLWSLRHRLPSTGSSVWVTSRTPQTESLLRGVEVVWIGPAEPRNWRHVMANAARINRLLKTRYVTVAISTGASVALSTLPLTAARGIRSIYIESATRVEGPSLTGRVMAAMPYIETVTQEKSWANGQWAYRGSIFDEFHPGRASTKKVRKVFVTVGTQDSFPFQALIDKVAGISDPAWQIVWQVGSAKHNGPGLLVAESMTKVELDDWLSWADVVVAHAGTGTALSALRSGKVPILVPRRAGRKEHVDDHQAQIARRLAERGLAIYREVDHLRASDFDLAASLTVQTVGSPPSLW